MSKQPIKQSNVGGRERASERAREGAREGGNKGGWERVFESETER